MSKSWTVSKPGVLAVLLSQNRKLGMASATYVAQGSCPRSCRLLGCGCYAENGPTGIITRRVGEEAAASSPTRLAEEEAEALRELPAAFDLRLHVVGDCQGREEARTVSDACSKWITAGKRAWTYTHSTTAIRDDWGGVSVLGSCEAGDDAGLRSVLERGFAPAIVVPSFPSRRFKHRGVSWIACLYETKKTACSSCRLCLDDEYLRRKGTGIAFAAHGSRKRRIPLAMVGDAA